MRTSAWWIAGLAGALGCTIACGCGKNDPPHGSGLNSGTGGTGNTGNTGGTGGAAAQGGTGATGGAVSFAIVDVPTTACVGLGAAPVELYAAFAIPGLYRLTPVGARWAAGMGHNSGFVVFDGDGQNASAAPVSLGDLDRIAGSSSGLSVATTVGEAAQYGRYDAQAASVGSPATIATGTIWDVEVGRAGDEAMVVVNSAEGPKARPVSASGEPAALFDLEAGTLVDAFSVAVTAADPSGFAITWSDRRVADSKYRTFIAFADASGMQGLVREVHTGTAWHRTVQVVATPSGYALLQELDGVPLVVSLDENGLVSGPAHRFVGTMGAWGIASNGTGLVVLVKRDDNREAFRALDLAGAPVGDWVCLNASSTANEHAGAIHADGNGFAVIFRATDDSEQLVKIADPVQGI